MSNIPFENSFASSDKAKYWHPTKNGNVKPRDISICNGKKCWFKCDCNHDFCSSLAGIKNGSWCPYCSHQKLCDNEECKFCFENSFASSDKAKYWHPTKNGNIKPRDISISNGKKCWFKCDCNHDFCSGLNHIKKCSWCPYCKNKTEKILLDYLNSKYEKVDFQPKYEWCKNPETNKYLPFDFHILENIIIELDGDQHIKQISNWKSPEENQERDIYKMTQAINNNKHIIRILQKIVFNDTFNWKEKLDEAIIKLQNETKISLICIGECEIYKQYLIE